MSIETEYPEINERGQRFRRVGQYCIEYAPSTIVHAPAPPEDPPKPRKGGAYSADHADPVFRGNVPKVQRELRIL